jgi:hypothetical protein
MDTTSIFICEFFDGVEGSPNIGPFFVPKWENRSISTNIRAGPISARISLYLYVSAHAVVAAGG